MRARACGGLWWVLAVSSCVDADADPALEAEAQAYCEALGAGSCPSDGRWQACFACYTACGAPCRGDTSLCNDEFVCEE